MKEFYDFFLYSTHLRQRLLDMKQTKQKVSRQAVNCTCESIQRTAQNFKRDETKAQIPCCSDV